MRVLVILGYTSSSISTPPNPNPNGNHRSTKPYKPPIPKLLSPSKSSSSAPPIISTRPPPLFAGTRWDPHHTNLSYFADLASKLARDGKLHDFSMLLESVVLSGVKPSQFTAALQLDMVSRGISGILEEGKVRGLVEVLVKVAELGVRPVELFDGYAMELLGAHCLRLLKFKQVQELVELMEVLYDNAWFRFALPNQRIGGAV